MWLYYTLLIFRSIKRSEHNLEEQYINIDNYFDDVPMAYRVRASIPNTFIFRVPQDVVPPCISCSIPLAIKPNLPDFQHLDVINARLTVELLPDASGELDTQGAKAFWSSGAKDAYKIEIGCIVHKAGAKPKMELELEQREEETAQPVTDTDSDTDASKGPPTPSTDVDPPASTDFVAATVALGDANETPSRNKSSGICVSFSDNLDDTVTGCSDGVAPPLAIAKGESLAEVSAGSNSQLAIPLAIVKPKTIYFLGL
jgi:hypothetical protein